MKFSPFVCAAALAAFTVSVIAAEPSVTLRRVPQGGFKPSVALDSAAPVRIHMVYFLGKPEGGDAFYVTSTDGGVTFSKPVQVNSQSGSVIGVSSIRGPQIALGVHNQVHVLWNGSSSAQPRAPLNPAEPADSPFNGTPLLYSRLNESGTGFEPQRNLMLQSCALDGGSAIAADGRGNVYVAWHALPLNGKGEADRTVWLSASTDNGRTFSSPRSILPAPSGVCACCSLTAKIGASGEIAILVRSAENDGADRPMNLLRSADSGASFSRTRLDQWPLKACPMSAAFILPLATGYDLAWEGKEGVRSERFLTGSASVAPEIPESRRPPSGSKYPVLATDPEGRTLLAWTEGMGWNKGGSVVWAITDSQSGRELSRGRADGVPAHGSIAAVSDGAGGFILFY